MSSVLYDTPGPKAKARNWIYSGIFVVLFGLVMWWALSLMAEKGQLDADKWTPFVTDSRVWTTYLIPGLLETLKAGALAMAIALPLGALLGIGRLSDHAWVRGAVGAWVEFFRAIPVLMLMLFGNALMAPQFLDVPSDTRPFWAVVLGLVLYNSAVIAEIVRAGVLSLPHGQSDAAKAIGMRKGQTMFHVLIPQAVTAMLPALVSQLVVILKDTAIGGALLGFAELLSTNRQISANYSNTIATLVVIALIYIAVNFALTSSASMLEGRLRKSKKSTGAVVGVNDVNDMATGANSGGG
ncbi:amino acid ABC transporter permease [Streptomyces virginiae]|uniref:amino acid ABC transporter permease n=1 Tax=Streptomyces virginiae TaxID=1961 RepID=UPI00224CFABA|nr:amino acid ABC transporter permease [Streptomyces virginiae]MCX4957683.1 amino acid ABC transporter permease [Streptomyces virginiae]MCX5176414.1 amino acid ABC transporter permease [Streptomyces virginiae]